MLSTFLIPHIVSRMPASLEDALLPPLLPFSISSNFRSCCHPYQWLIWGGCFLTTFTTVSHEIGLFFTFQHMCFLFPSNQPGIPITKYFIWCFILLARICCSKLFIFCFATLLRQVLWDGGGAPGPDARSPTF